MNQGSRLRRGGIAAGISLALALTLAPAAGASVTFGDSLGVPEGIIKPVTCASSCTLSTTISPEELAWFRAPVSGMIVRWRIQTAASPASQLIRFRVIAPVAGDEFTEALTEPFAAAGASGPVQAPTAAGTFAFPTDLQVSAGDFIGLDTEGLALSVVAAEEESVRVFEPALAQSGEPAPGRREAVALLLNADIATPPTSGAPPACSAKGLFTVPVRADTDPAVRPRALWVRIDGSAAQPLPVAGTPSSAAVPVPAGVHTLEYWAEDSLGQSEAQHHLARVLTDGSPPVVAVRSDQATGLYTVGQPATVTVTASDAGSPLVSDPSGSREAIPTGRAGAFQILRTATDACGNSATASFSYRVLAPARVSRLRVAPARTRAGRLRGRVLYTDANEALARVTIERALSGVRSVHGCIARPRARVAARPCTRFEKAATFTRLDGAGPNQVQLAGRIGAAVLGAGSYRILVGPDAAGGRVAAARFRVLP